MFSAAVCSHTSRWKQAVALAGQLGCRTTMDNGSLGSTRNHARAWSEALTLSSDAAEWVAVVEDDAIPVPNIRAEMDAILAQSPAPIVSGYLGTGRPPQYQPLIRGALSADPAWVIADELLHHVAVFVQRKHVPGLIAFLEAHPNHPCDEAISIWACNNRLPVAYPIPSPFDHADTPPVIRDEDRVQPIREARVAWQHGTRPDWSGGRIALLDQKTKNRYGHMFGGR